MKLKWIAAAIGLGLLVRSSSRNQGPGEAGPGIKRQFAHVARLRLVAACPRLDRKLRERTLRDLFDWIVTQMCVRTGTSDPHDLPAWAERQGPAAAQRMIADLSREAVDTLPRPVLTVIDGCGGRTVAGVLLCEALTESGRRAGYGPGRQPT